MPRTNGRTAAAFAAFIMALSCAVPEARAQAPFSQESVASTKLPESSYAAFLAFGSGSGPVVPGLRQGFVPQGLAYWRERGWILVSGYIDGGASRLVVLDAASGAMAAALGLEAADGRAYAGHAGGLAVGEGAVYIAGDRTIYVIPLGDVAAAVAGGRGAVRFGSSFPTATNASFCAYSDGVLWVGDFYQEKDYPSAAWKHLRTRDGSVQCALAVGYRLDRGGAPVPASGEPAPDYALSIKDRVQGMAFLPGLGAIALSESYGRKNDSHLCFYADPLAEAPHAAIAIGGASVPLWYLDGLALRKTLTAPPMTEGIDAADGVLLVLFESGADKYMNGSPAGKHPIDRLWSVDLSRLAAWLAE